MNKPALKLEQYGHMYIGCIPVHMHPRHPEDQSPCIVMPCNHCHKDMWVSEKKREMLKEHPETYKMYCFVCLAEAAHDAGLTLDMCDINKRN